MTKTQGVVLNKPEYKVRVDFSRGIGIADWSVVCEYFDVGWFGVIRKKSEVVFERVEYGADVLTHKGSAKDICQRVCDILNEGVSQ